jgi:phosphate transport system protein
MQDDHPEFAHGFARVAGGRHAIRDQEVLWDDVIKLASMVAAAVATSIHALCDGRIDLAAEVVGQESKIDRWEVRVERECLRVLALYEPVASDLRRVASVLKINAELERMADLAEHIARRVRKLARKANAPPIPAKIKALATATLEHVHESLHALAESDAELARKVIASDRRIDRLRRDVLRDLKQSIQRDPDQVDSWLRLINTARNLERVADHAGNISEAVIYLKEGDIIRHAVSEA